MLSLFSLDLLTPEKCHVYFLFIYWLLKNAMFIFSWFIDSGAEPHQSSPRPRHQFQQLFSIHQLFHQQVITSILEQFSVNINRI